MDYQVVLNIQCSSVNMSKDQDAFRHHYLGKATREIQSILYHLIKAIQELSIRPTYLCEASSRVKVFLAYLSQGCGVLGALLAF